MNNPRNKEKMAVSRAYSACHGCEKLVPDDQLWLRNYSWLCAECYGIDPEELHLESALESKREARYGR